jgi:hypothetical protein
MVLMDNPEHGMDAGALALQVSEFVGLPVKVEVAGMWAPVVALREVDGQCVILTLARDWDPKLPETTTAG